MACYCMLVAHDFPFLVAIKWHTPLNAGQDIVPPRVDMQDEYHPKWKIKPRFYDNMHALKLRLSLISAVLAKPKVLIKAVKPLLTLSAQLMQ